MKIGLVVKACETFVVKSLLFAGELSNLYLICTLIAYYGITHTLTVCCNELEWINLGT